MPIYEFQCANCGNIFEEKRSFSESNAPAECPKCGAPNAKRLITGGAAIFRPMTPGEIGTSEYSFAQRSFSRMTDAHQADQRLHAADDHELPHEHHAHDHHDHGHAEEAHHHDEPAT